MYSSQTQNSSTSLKRARDDKQLPPLPKLTSELILQVYTHISLRRQTGVGPEEYGDNERLIELGKAVLDALVTNVLFNRRPMLKVGEICYQRNRVLLDENIEGWVTAYGMRQRLRCHPDVFATLYTPKEARSIFYSYVGGIYVEHGLDTVREWLSELLGVENDDRPPATSKPGPVQRLETPPLKKVKSEETPPTLFVASQPPRSPRAKFIHSPPPHQMPTTVPNPLAPAQPGLPFLPLFNQTAAQRRVTVEYPAEFIGPPHAGRWTVQCIVNGISKGVGSGSSKQVAKEEAARQAYYAMGWT